LFPGRTFANVVEKGDYRPEEWARMTLEQARDLFKLWVVDIYHNKPHGGLMGKTPLKRWEELKGFGVRLPPAAEDLDALIGLVVQRQIRREGIKYLGLTYWSKEIDALHLQPGRSRDDWTIRIDTEDLTTISVLDPEKGKLLHVPCHQASLVQNLNIHMWREVCEEARRLTPAGERVRRSALLEARQRIAEAAKKMGNKPRAKVTKHDLDWMEAHADDPEFDVSDDDTPSSATGGRRRPRQGKSSPSNGPGDTRQDDLDPTSQATGGGVPLPERDISEHPNVEQENFRHAQYGGEDDDGAEIEVVAPSTHGVATPSAADDNGSSESSTITSIDVGEPDAAPSNESRDSDISILAPTAPSHPRMGWALDNNEED
jgi:putative transposase